MDWFAPLSSWLLQQIQEVTVVWQSMQFDSENISVQLWLNEAPVSAMSCHTIIPSESLQQYVLVVRSYYTTIYYFQKTYTTYVLEYS